MSLGPGFICHHCLTQFVTGKQLANYTQDASHFQVDDIVAVLVVVSVVE